jgi:hypothetical protein
MHMIRHQAIGMDCARVLLCELAEVKEVKQVIAFAEEAVRSVVTSLRDVRRYPGQQETRLPRHACKNDAAVVPVDLIGL